MMQWLAESKLNGMAIVVLVYERSLLNKNCLHLKRVTGTTASPFAQLIVYHGTSCATLSVTLYTSPPVEFSTVYICACACDALETFCNWVSCTYLQTQKEPIRPYMCTVHIEFFSGMFCHLLFFLLLVLRLPLNAFSRCEFSACICVLGVVCSSFPLACHVFSFFFLSFEFLFHTVFRCEWMNEWVNMCAKCMDLVKRTKQSSYRRCIACWCLYNNTTYKTVEKLLSFFSLFRLVCRE